jgi:type II secretory pathway pseudopilin PulG
LAVISIDPLSATTVLLANSVTAESVGAVSGALSQPTRATASQSTVEATAARRVMIEDAGSAGRPGLGRSGGHARRSASMTGKNTKRMRRRAVVTKTAGERGYAMAVLLVGIAVMLTLMTVAMPVWRQQQRREREEELLFRLKQYAHALALYQRRLPGASPATVDDLVKQRFLRKKYLDPMTGKEFAILRVGQVSPGMTASTPAGVGASPTPQAGRQGGGPMAGQGPRAGGGGNQGRPGAPQPGMVLGGSGTGVGGAVGGIRGVVSTSKETSLRAWKGRTQYDQWEVAIEDVTPRFFGQQVPQPGQNQRPGGPGQNRPGQVRPQPMSPGQGPANPYGLPNNRP